MELILKQIESVVDKELPLISNLSNISSILFKMGDINWAGFYLADGDYLYLDLFKAMSLAQRLRLVTVFAELV